MESHPPPSSPPPSYHTVLTDDDPSPRSLQPTSRATTGPSTRPEDEEVVLRWSPDPSQRPVGPVTYTFSRLTSNTMLLLPPPQAPDSRPLFHISVETNCFRPASFLTVVRRGGSAQGPFVGEFEMGPQSSHDRVVIGDVAKKLQPPTLTWSQEGSLKWQFGPVTLRWTSGRSSVTRQPMSACSLITSSRKVVEIAVWRSFDPLVPRGGARPMPTLTIKEEGKDIVDHILITALILQRERYLATA